MMTVGLVFAALAALIHVYIFVLESFLFTKPQGRKAFGIRSADDAETMKQLAYNQGFYNLFLAIGAIVGIVLVVADRRGGGSALILFATGSMLAAGAVLALSDPRLLRGALLQIVPSLIAIVATVIALG